MCENIENCCRICLDVESNHVPILEDLTISLHLKSCLSIIISSNDELPKGICESCVTQLSQFYNFQLNARCSQDWLESSIQEMSKKTTETKAPIQPLPDSEYNSDSLLEFLNNTANIEEYLTNLGKEDIPSLVNMLDRNHENSMEVVNRVATSSTKSVKQLSPKKKDGMKPKNCKLNMEIDILDSDIEIVQEILMKETEPKKQSHVKLDLNTLTCFACKTKFDNIQKLSQHLSTCDIALCTCIHCNLLFDSKLKMQLHSLTHSTSPLTCNCGKQFAAKDLLMQHFKRCYADHTAIMGYTHRCKQCKKTFKERFQLYRHAKEHIIAMDKRICDICGHIFIGSEALSKHKKEIHDSSSDSLYRCKVCTHTSADRKEIYLHVKQHLEAQDKNRHLCESCGRGFATRASLARHSLLHNNIQHQCKMCNTIFKDVKTRDEHVLGHTEIAMCEKCGQNVNSYKLDGHLCA